MKGRWFKSIIFCMIGIMIFMVLQYVFLPKRFPYIKTNDMGRFQGYISEKEGSIDILICGTSHAARGILPMELYEKYGIRSYNLSSPGQPIEATYYILSEALKTQNPAVFIYDASNLYGDKAEVYWRMVLDDMPFGENKVALAKEYVTQMDNVQASMKDLLFPLLGYHARWNELEKEDFVVPWKSRDYFGKGGTISSIVSSSGISVDAMNNVAAVLSKDTERMVYQYEKGGGGYEEREESRALDVSISDNNLKWFVKIKELCDENNVQFLAVKVPTVYYPQIYESAWTKEKFHMVRALCDEYGIAYCDLLYETDINFDLGKDSCDGGKHLNLNGAQKVCENLGRYLKEHYELPDEHDEQWDRDLLLYREARGVAQLELEQDLAAYITILANDYKDKTIYIAASNDMATGLSEDEIIALRKLGLQVDFSAALQDAYIAVIENGEVKYEVRSNRQISYEGICGKSEKKFEIYSSGWRTNPEAAITIDGVEYSYNYRGMNILVYDNVKELVLDSVCFDTYLSDHIVVRDSAMTNKFMEDFERYLVENE